MPVTLALLALLYPLDTGRSYESRLLLPLLNVVFLTGAPWLVAYRAARSMRDGAPVPVLFLGTGMVVLGSGSLLAAVALLAGFGPNAMVTEHNTAAFVAAACCLTGSVVAATPRDPAPAATPGVTVVAIYGGAVLVMLLVWGAAVRGALPLFIRPSGPTLVRQILLGSAVAMMALAALLMRFQRGRTPEPFLSWCANGLALIATGLAGVLLPTVVGGPVSWVGRAAQYLGCAYLFLAVRSVKLAPESWAIPVNQTLRETSDRYRILVDLCPDAIIVHSAGRVVFVNPAAIRLFGAEAISDLVEHDVIDWVMPSMREQVARRIRQVYEGSPVPLAEIAIRRGDGTVITVETTGARVEYAGHPAVLTVLRDVEDRKRAEAALRDREERLRIQAAELAEANRLKDEFLATLSHELRTPLNAILGWAQMLVANRLDAAGARHALEVIERNARVQTSLISDVLDVSRIISGKLTLNPRRVDLGECLRAALDSVAPGAEAKRIQIAQHVDRGAEVFGDPDRLQQVLWNLLSNAVKFTPDGGHVSVRVGLDATTVTVEVGDSGIGIESDFLPHVFERFRQADGSPTKRHGGLGLGLAIVRHLVELHGGVVTAHSEGLGKGAAFRVQLPAVVTATPSVPAGDSLPAGLPQGGDSAIAGARLLAVDDEPDARELLQVVLRSHGADVRVAATAREAIDVLRQWQPDVLVTDLGMPVEDGYDLIRLVRAIPAERGGTIPVIALTAHGRDDDRARALTAGFAAHVSKPVVPEDLVRVVASVRERRRG